MPRAVIRRRFGRSLINFHRVYRPLADTWRVYDANDISTRPLIASGTRTGRAAIADEAKWAEIRKQIAEAS